MRSGLFSLLLLILVAPSPAGATVVRHDRPLADTEKAALRFPATARFLPDGSGTLVDPRWVLTAAHVARGISPFHHEVEIAGQRHEVARVVLHPRSGFHPQSEWLPGYASEADAALVQLRDVVVGVAPVRPFTDLTEVGRVATLAGFGDFGHARDADFEPQNGVCRAVTNRVAYVLHDYLAFPFDEGDDATELEGVGGPGDSGGPLYLEEEGEIFVAGISSFSAGRPLDYGSVDHYFRVAMIAGWIQETISQTQLPSEPEIIDLQHDSLPDSPRAALARQFVDRFNEGPAAFRDFATRDGSPAEWAGLAGRREIYGELTALQYMDVDERHSALLVSLGAMGGYRVIHLWFNADETRIEDVSLGVASEPTGATR
ncbi:MAG: hypothetical protein DHS20C21_13860 [Gemmatimonadota bacterium]|nr:MAG: hypothetical protein DHS20C21_13860 [Gemmatimonadota bacterium]